MAHIKLAIITGSGLDFSNILDTSHQKESLTEIFTNINSQIAGHSYQILHGFIDSIPTIICSGRIHAYEGYPFEQFQEFVTHFQKQGITHLISINAVGGLSKNLSIGSFVLIKKVICNKYNPFPLPSTIYPSWIFKQYHPRGTYIWVTGPCYETQSELRLFLSQGGDVIGMSGGPELYWATQLGIKTAMFSCVTNYCFNPSPITHDQVVNNAQNACNQFLQTFRNSLVKELQYS